MTMFIEITVDGYYNSGWHERARRSVSVRLAKIMFVEECANGTAFIQMTDGTGWSTTDKYTDIKERLKEL